MAIKIPILEERVQTSALPSVRNTGIDVAAAGALKKVGAGVTDLGAGIGKLAKEAQRQQEREDKQAERLRKEAARRGYQEATVALEQSLGTWSTMLADQQGKSETIEWVYSHEDEFSGNLEQILAKFGELTPEDAHLLRLRYNLNWNQAINRHIVATEGRLFAESNASMMALADAGAARAAGQLPVHLVGDKLKEYEDQKRRAIEIKGERLRWGKDKRDFELEVGMTEFHAGVITAYTANDRGESAKDWLEKHKDEMIPGVVDGLQGKIDAAGDRAFAVVEADRIIEAHTDPKAGPFDISALGAMLDEARKIEDEGRRAATMQHIRQWREDTDRTRRANDVDKMARLDELRAEFPKRPLNKKSHDFVSLSPTGRAIEVAKERARIRAARAPSEASKIDDFLRWNFLSLTPEQQRNIDIDSFAKDATLPGRERIRAEQRKALNQNDARESEARRQAQDFSKRHFPKGNATSKEGLTRAEIVGKAMEWYRKYKNDHGKPPTAAEIEAQLGRHEEELRIRGYDIPLIGEIFTGKKKRRELEEGDVVTGVHGYGGVRSVEPEVYTEVPTGSPTTAPDPNEPDLVASPDDLPPGVQRHPKTGELRRFDRDLQKWVPYE